MDIKSLIEYINSDENPEKRENANRLVGSFGWFKSNIAEEIIKEYTLNYVIPEHIAKAHKDGDIHIHDLRTGFFIPYCCGWSLQKILYQGFNGVSNVVEARPPKHLSSALGQIVNFLGVVQQEAAGAQAINSLDTLLAPYVYYDKLSYKEVKQAIQEFVYNLNVTYRWGCETPFTNVTFDLVPPEDLANIPVVIGGEVKDRCYGDFQEEMDIINKAFLEVMYEGDGNGTVFTFPIPTYNITEDFPWDSEVGELLSKVTAKWGIPYFQNCISSGLSPRDVRAMCCRLQLDMRELSKRIGGIFGYGDQTGSIGVVTINLARLGYISSDETEFFDRLERLMEISKECLEIKRKIINENLDSGVMPYIKVYLGNIRFRNHFSTIGVIAGNEACLNLLGCSIADKEGHEFMIRVLDFMRDKIKQFQEETGNLYNLEATPAEGTSYRLALLDKKKYPDIITSGTPERPYYTNSTQLPVDYTDRLWWSIKHQEPLQSRYTGGTVLHIFLGESPQPEVAAKLVDVICRKSKLPYITLTPTYSKCPKCGYIRGEHTYCPNCDSKCLIFSRVVGYYRPVDNWNPGKQQEFKERKYFNIQI